MDYITEPTILRYAPILEKEQLAPLTFLEGYWQSEKYFQSSASQIRDELAMIEPPGGYDRTLRRKIESTATPVAVHARRLYSLTQGQGADPLSHEDSRSLKREYYENAITRILESSPNCHFFCFGDAPEWFAANMPKRVPFTIVDQRHHVAASGLHDFWMMRQCRHFVISNSTFSWWAAWLGRHPDKMVICPEAKRWDNQDTVPSSWTSLTG
ncbi:MAG: alpha-1,2-fucosyltransferase [Myxococcales bacterium]|nr:alpha-1,2-fucosyltransferase [Myxococcales bacterium]